MRGHEVVWDVNVVGLVVGEYLAGEGEAAVVGYVWMRRSMEKIHVEYNGDVDHNCRHCGGNLKHSYLPGYSPTPLLKTGRKETGARMTHGVKKKKEIKDTHAAVAAKTSCLLALVNTDNAAEKKKVNSKMTAILMLPCSCTLNSTTTGAISSETASRVMTSRTRMSIRSLEYRCT